MLQQDEQLCGHTMEQDTELEPLAKRKRRVINKMIALSIGLGVVDCLIPEPLILLTSIPLLAMGVSWCRLDADQHNLRIGRLWVFAIVLLWIVALPIHMLRTRGVRGIPVSVAAVLFVAVLFGLEYASQIVTLEIGDALGIWHFEI